MLAQRVGADRLRMAAVKARETKQSCWEIQSYALGCLLTERGDNNNLSRTKLVAKHAPAAPVQWYDESRAFNLSFK